MHSVLQSRNLSHLASFSAPTHPLSHQILTLFTVPKQPLLFFPPPGPWSQLVELLSSNLSLTWLPYRETSAAHGPKAQLEHSKLSATLPQLQGSFSDTPDYFASSCSLKSKSLMPPVLAQADCSLIILMGIRGVAQWQSTCLSWVCSPAPQMKERGKAR